MTDFIDYSNSEVDCSKYTKVGFEEFLMNTIKSDVVNYAKKIDTDILIINNKEKEDMFKYRF
jgi:hypothetical protein